MKKGVKLAMLLSSVFCLQNNDARVKVTNLLGYPVLFEYHWTPATPYVDESDKVFGVFPKIKLRSSLQFEVLPISWPRGRSPFGGAGLGGGIPEMRDAELLNPKTRYIVRNQEGVLLYDKVLDSHEYGNRALIIKKNDQGNIVVESSADWSL